MPPLHEGSSQEVISKNIEEMIRAGHPPDVAKAAAYANARKTKKKKQHGEETMSKSIFQNGMLIGNPKDLLLKAKPAVKDNDDDDDDNDSSDDDMQKAFSGGIFVGNAFDLMKARGGSYSGKGRRTGTPGNYKYIYGNPKGRSSGKGKEEDKKKAPAPKKETAHYEAHGIEPERHAAVTKLLDHLKESPENITKVSEGPYGHGQTIHFGNEEYAVMTDDEAEQAAKEYVQNLIDDQGVTAFKEDFWKSHIDKKKLGNELAEDSSHEYDHGYESPEDFLEGEEEPDDGWTDEQREEAGDKAEEAYEKKVKDDPMGYLEDIFGDDMEGFDLSKYVDEKALAQEAVDTDGVAHFLAGYDGNEIDLGNGYNAYRTN